MEAAGSIIINGVIDGKDGKDGKDGANGQNAVSYKIDCIDIIKPGDDYFDVSIIRSDGATVSRKNLLYAKNDWGVTLSCSGLAGAKVEDDDDSQVNLTNCTITGNSKLILYLTLNGTIVDEKYLRGVTNGSAGKMGPLCYIAGAYRDDIVYESDERQTVAVEVDAGNNTTEIYYLNAATNLDSNGNHIAPTDYGQSRWVKGLNEYNLIRTKYLFADFAHLGSAIVSGDWMFSQHGTIDGVAVSGSDYYTKFDPKFPLGTGIYTALQTRSYAMTSSYVSFGETEVIPGCRYGIKISGKLTSKNNDNCIMYARIVGIKSNGDETTLASGNMSSTDDTTFINYSQHSSNVYSKIRIEACRSNVSGVNYYGQITFIEFIPVDGYFFIPNYALDMLRGTTYQNDGVFRGSISAAKYEYKIFFEADQGMSTADSISKADYAVLSSSNGSRSIGSPFDYAGRVITIINSSKRTNDSNLYLSCSYNIVPFAGSTGGSGNYNIGWSRMVKIWADGDRGVWRVIEQDLY